MKTLALSLALFFGLAGLAASADNAGAATTCDTTQVARNIAYVTDPVSPLQRLDIYGFEGSDGFDAAPGCDNRPVVMWVHGGGWRRGDKRNEPTKVSLFNDLGYVFVSVNYRLSDPPGDPDRPIHPAHANDVGAAVAWVEDNIDQYGGDGGNIELLGHSAGGHLVSLVGLDPRYIEQAGGDADSVGCVISNDTEGYDLVERAAPGGLSARLVANAFGTDTSTYPDASPINHVADRDDPPDFLVITRGLPHRVAAAQTFADAVEGAGASVDVLRPFGLTHGDVNRLIGTPGDTVVTPTVEEFTTSCLS